MTPNTEWKKAGVSACAGVIFSLVTLLSLTTMDGMSGGYALAFITFFLAASSFVILLLYLHRARVMQKILSDPAPLARWSYPEEMIHATIEREYADYRERNRAMFYLIGGMLVVAALFFLLVVEDGGPETAAALLVFTLFLFVISRVAPRYERWRAYAASREAFITDYGIIYQGRVYPFRSFRISRPRVTYRRPARNEPAAVVFSFVQQINTVSQPFDVAIPVPPGQEESARKLVRDLGGEAEP